MKKTLFLILMIFAISVNLFSYNRENWVITKYEVSTSTYSYFGIEKRGSRWWEIQRSLKVGDLTQVEFAVGKGDFDAYFVGRSTLTYTSVNSTDPYTA